MKSKNDDRKEGRGIIFIISAPSGTGKTTLLRQVMEELPNLRFSVSYTTRLPRANEQEAKDYHFVSPSEFQKMVEKDEFLEWSEVLGSHYGTPRIDMDRLKSKNIDLVLDIDTQGAKKVMEKVDDAISIYILPPSLKALEERLVKRKLDTPETIKFRLNRAKRDMEEARGYHYVMVNDRIEDAVQKLKSIIIAERCRKGKTIILKEKIDQWEEHHGENYSGGLSEKGGEPV